MKWEVRSLPLLLRSVIPHFRMYPLVSGKRRDSELFADICERMARGQHLGRDGLLEIARRACQMNPSGKRVYPAEQILRSLSETKA